MLVCFALWFQFEHNGVHICPGFERAPNLIVHFVWRLYHAEQGQWEPSSGAASLGRVATARDRVRVGLWPRLEDQYSGPWLRLPLFP